MNFNISIPKDVEFIIKRIESEGYETYIVGGCVRDSLLGRIPSDWDITTNAKPEDIQRIFNKVIPTGIKHGTVTIMIGSEGYEVTTYRMDGEYSDSRRPDNVEFTDDITKDLSRRDFRMNAIAYNPTRGFVDPFDGIRDIKNKVIQTVGKPGERFREDYLRMLRAIRFEYQLGFELEPYVLYEVEENAHLLKNIAKERIQSELNKILLCENVYFINRLSDTGILKYIHPELMKLTRVEQNNPYHIHNVWFHTIKTIENVDNELYLKLAAWLHDIGKKDTKTTDSKGIDHFYGHDKKSVEISEHILKDLRYDNKTIEKVLTLIRFHDRQVEPNLKSVKRFLNKIGGYELFRDWAELRWADMLAQNPKHLKERARDLTLIECMAKEIIETKQPIEIKDLDINGNDLIKLGYRGAEIGLELRRLLEVVIETPYFNTKDKLIKISNMKKRKTNI